MSKYVGGDVTAWYHGGDENSTAAYLSVKDSKNRMLNKIVNYLTENGGMTCDQLEYELGLPHTSTSARITEGLAKGLLERTGEKRNTRSGHKAWVVVRKGN